MYMASFQKYKTKQGDKWLFKMGVGTDPLTGNRKTTTRRGFKTKKEAQQAAAELEKEMRIGITTDTSITYDDVFFEWWVTHTKTIKPSTKYSKASKFDKHIRPKFGKLKMKDISKTYCQKVVNEWAEQMSSVNDIKIQANLVFKYAVKMDYIERNPMDHVVIPKKEEDFLAKDEERNYWTKSELKKFLFLSKEHMEYQDYVMFYTLIYTGMRKGELIAIEKDDINFNKRSININKTMYFEKGKEIVQTAKKYASVRTIEIDEDTALILQEWLSKRDEMLSEAGISKDVKNVFIRDDFRPLRLAYPNDVLASFFNKFKEKLKTSKLDKTKSQSFIDIIKANPQMNTSDVTQLFSATFGFTTVSIVKFDVKFDNDKEFDLTEINIKATADGNNYKIEYKKEKHELHKITIHGLRHTHASLLFEAGATIKEVQDRLGHKDAQTTMNVYTHVTKTMAEKTAQTFKNFIDLD